MTFLLVVVWGVSVEKALHETYKDNSLLDNTVTVFLDHHIITRVELRIQELWVCLNC